MEKVEPGNTDHTTRPKSMLWDSSCHQLRCTPGANLSRLQYVQEKMLLVTRTGPRDTVLSLTVPPRTSLATVCWWRVRTFPPSFLRAGPAGLRTGTPLSPTRPSAVNCTKKIINDPLDFMPLLYQTRILSTQVSEWCRPRVHDLEVGSPMPDAQCLTTRHRELLSAQGIFEKFYHCEGNSLSLAYLKHLSRRVLFTRSDWGQLLLIVLYTCDRYLTHFNVIGDSLIRDHFVCGSSQWELALQCNAISDWLGAYAEWTLTHLGIPCPYSLNSPWHHPGSRRHRLVAEVHHKPLTLSFDLDRRSVSRNSTDSKRTSRHVLEQESFSVWA